MSQLLARLGSDLDAIGVGSRDAPGRQRTLAATLEWSYTLLSASEQPARLALAVFAGGCTLDAAQAVTDAPLEVLEALAAKNLLSVQSRSGETTRVGMRGIVRDFARARLLERAEVDDLRERHCEHYLARAERARPQLERSGSPALLAELGGELENIRTALRWASDHAAGLALRLGGALSQ